MLELKYYTCMQAICKQSKISDPSNHKDKMSCSIKLICGTFSYRTDE